MNNVLQTLGQRVSSLRKTKGFSQEELAEESKISLRTIQRIEKDTTQPRGHTLKAIAAALDCTLEQLQDFSVAQTSVAETTSQDFHKLNMLNLSCLGILGLPFGNLIFPLLLYRKFKGDQELKLAARKVINFQIIWYIIVAPTLILIPLLQQTLDIRFPLILAFAVVAIAYNLFIVIRNTMRIKQGNLNIYPGIPNLF